MLIAWMSLALSQSAPDGPDATASVTRAPTIIVYGEGALQDARDDVVASLVPLGWRASERGETVVFTPPRWWLGKARLYADGRLVFGRSAMPVRGAAVGAAGGQSTTGTPAFYQAACGGAAASAGEQLYVGSLSGVADGVHPLTFSLYDAADAPRAIWRDVTDVAVVEGVYTVHLGSGRPLHLAPHQRYWLGVEAPDAPATRVPFSAARSPEGSTPCAPEGPDFDPWAQQQPPVNLQATSGGVFGANAKRRREHEEAAVAAAGEALRHYGDVLAETALRDKLDRLPVALDALWERGAPLYPGDVVVDVADRRAVVLDLWATRSPNDAGARLCAAIEDWLAAVVMTSDSPLTEAERVAAEARRTDGRRLPR